MLLRNALRIFIKHPRFAAAAAGSLAVGIGLAAALASVADAILFRPLPVPRPNEIVRVYTASRLQSLGYFSYPDYEDLSRSSTTLSGMLAQSQVLLAVSARALDAPQVRMGLAVTSNYFDLLGVQAQLGRTLRIEDDRAPVVVLSDAFWRARFGRDRGILGRTLQIGSTPFTVIGVAPSGFGLDRFLREDYYIPIGIYKTGRMPGDNGSTAKRTQRFLSVYARRAAPLPVVQAELTALSARLEAQYPDADRGRRAVALSEIAARMRSDKTMPAIAAVLLTLAVLMLAIACANVSGLLILRGEARTGDIALRSAMGAGSLRLLGESVTETLVLALAAVAMAIPLAWSAVRAAVRAVTLPTDMPLMIDARIDGRIWALAAGAGLLVALICALPAWLATRRTSPSAALRRAGSARVSGGNRLRSALVIAQVALAGALIASGGMLLESMLAAGRINLGYRIDHVLALAFDPAQTRSDESHAHAFYRDLLDRVRRLPGVKAVALAQSVPLGLTGAQRQVSIPGISPAYFELMRMPLLAGRAFDDRDTATTPAVAVVNETLAKLWPAGAALGRSMEINGRRIQIVGVVQTAKYFSISEAPRPFFYLPYSQNYVTRMVLHVETAGSPAAIAPAVVAAARVVDAAQTVSEVRALEQYFSQGALFGTRIGFDVTAVTGGCALLLALAGLYSSIASTLQRRRREIGIRRALGASTFGIVRLVLAHGVRLAVIGSAAGAAVALAAKPWLISVPQSNVATVLIAAALVIAASLAACFIPAWRSARLDPAVALRQD
jgi:predicted permease